MEKEATFVIVEFYTAHIDESGIDGHKREYTSWNEEKREEHFTRLHRMFQSILSNNKALRIVLEYVVLIEHGVRSQDDTGPYLEDHYGESETDFLDVLMHVSSCFTQEDRVWIANLIESHREVKERLHRIKEGYDEDREELEERGDLYKLNELEECFAVEHSGWDIKSHGV